MAFCVEGLCWDVPWSTLGASWYAAVTPQEPPPCPEIPNEMWFGATGLLRIYEILDSAPGHAPMSADEKEGVRDGFANWTAKNLQTGLNARYCEFGSEGCGPPGATPHITVQEGKPAPPSPWASMDITTVGGYPTRGEITISSDPARVLGRVAYKKFVQHELGHFHGMGEATSASVGSTVMRTPAGDNGQYLPDEPTQCDADKAYERRQ